MKNKLLKSKLATFSNKDMRNIRYCYWKKHNSSLAHLKCPTSSVTVARLHTHGDINPRFDSEKFSSRDRINANNFSLWVGQTVYSYLGTPEGKFLKFIPASVKGSIRGKVIKLTP